MFGTMAVPEVGAQLIFSRNLIVDVLKLQGHSLPVENLMIGKAIFVFVRVQFCRNKKRNLSTLKQNLPAEHESPLGVRHYTSITRKAEHSKI